MFLLILFWGITLKAQDFNHYQSLECSGNIPADFTISSGKKYAADIKTIAKADFNQQEAKARQTFALESNFVLDDLLKSGLVLFNDPVSNYLNEVCAQVTKTLKSDKNIRVYALRSTAVNAFATNQGAIFVTLGILAQLENEAQLAYVLAHEIIHVLDAHPIDLFLEAQAIERTSSQRSVLGSTTFDDKILAKNRYSKELESSADAKGLELMLKTDYSTATLHTVFDVLKYSYLPFDEIPFDRSFMETNGIKFPEKYWLDKVNPIRGEDEFAEDSKSDHPNIAQRRAALARILQNTPGKGTQNFVLPENRFFHAQKIARFELPLLHLRRGELSEAIYTAYLLSKENNSLYLEKCVVKALYLHAKYLNDADYTYISKVDSIEGEIQQVFHFLKQLNKTDATVLALQKAWKLQQQAPDDMEIKQLHTDLFVEIGQYYKNLEDFKEKTVVAESPKPPVATSNDKPKTRSKYDRIKEKQQEAGITSNSTGQNYLNRAFDEFIEDTAFKTAFDQGQTAYQQRIKDEETYNSKKSKEDWEKQQLKEMRHGANLGISKVVIVNPFFVKLNEKKDNPVLYLDTESGQNKFSDMMQDMAKKAALKAVFLDVESLKETQTDQFNDIRVLNEWFAEQVQFSDLSLTPGLQQARIDTLANKYGTDYFLWTGAISLLPKSHNAIQPILGALIFWPQLPWAIANAANPKYDLLYYAILFDVRTMKRRVIKFEYLSYSDFDPVVKAHSYDAFLQIRKK